MSKTADKMKNDIKTCSSIKAKLMLGGVLTAQKIADRLRQDPDVQGVQNTHSSVVVETQEQSRVNKLDVSMYSRVNNHIRSLLQEEKAKISGLLDQNEIIYYNSENNQDSLSLLYSINTTKRGLILNI